MNLAAGVIGGYGLFTTVGGIIGYVKAKSTASLVAGAVCGAALIFCAAGLQQGHRAAAWGSMAVALALGLRFARTWRAHHRVMPDLLMILGSLLALLVAGATLLR